MGEEQKIEQPMGNIKISEEVVAIISGIAASEVSGVAGMSNTFASGIAELLGKKSLAKGVRVELEETTTSIGISLVVEYGCKIPDVAWEVQEKVKKAVETMTGLEVLEVNIFIDGLIMPKEEKPSEPEE
ncbi:MAG: Asp23/Gls24 family envelope stress response protein [Firmicutes bacterium]|nr:Asp23/Gls24 family envelope stress response protein [Bacillota bacterium]